jgi:hypothetical protein
MFASDVARFWLDLTYALPARAEASRSNWLRYCPGDTWNQRLQARKKLLWSANPSR